MLLWDVESNSWPPLIEALSAAAKRRLALDGIELSFGLFRPSFEQAFEGSTVLIARESLSLLRRQIDAESLGVPEVEFFDKLYEIPKYDHSPGAASIVMAISEYADAMRRELSGADVLAVMSACYEAILNSERIPRVSIEAERGNQNCLLMISRQRALIDEAVAHGG